MPLRDHFRPPLGMRRHWHAFHNSWATYISADLNRRLPEGYFAEANVQFGIEIDVATYAESGAAETSEWSAPAPAQTVPIALGTDIVEVLAFHSEGGPVLAGAIELVSPANKDRPKHRDAFVAKCMAYLQQGIGLVVVDVVTERQASLHDELLARVAETAVDPLNAPLYAAAYRPVERDGRTSLDVWPEVLSVGSSLPTLPLWLRGGLSLPVELDATYDRTCAEQRVPTNGV